MKFTKCSCDTFLRKNRKKNSSMCEFLDTGLRNTGTAAASRNERHLSAVLGNSDKSSREIEAIHRVEKAFDRVH